MAGRGCAGDLPPGICLLGSFMYFQGGGSPRTHPQGAGGDRTRPEASSGSRFPSVPWGVWRQGKAMPGLFCLSCLSCLCCSTYVRSMSTVLLPSVHSISTVGFILTSRMACLARLACLAFLACLSCLACSVLRALWFLIVLSYLVYLVLSCLVLS